MTTRLLRLLTSVAALLLFALPAHAQVAEVDIITPHITDAHEIEIPWPTWPTMHKVVHLPRWAPIHVPVVGAVDMSPTKHVVWMLIAALTILGLMLYAANAQDRKSVV